MINNNTTVHVYIGMLELPLHKDGLVDIRVPGVGYWIERERYWEQGRVKEIAESRRF